MKFLISPWSRPLRNGKMNAKNYPFFSALIMFLTSAGIGTIQIGLSYEAKYNCSAHMPDLSMDSLAQLLREVDGFISVDNFFPHFANFHKKSGVVLFGRSDPNIFGYPENLNIIKDRSLLRPQQFANWEDIEHTNDCFVPPKDVFRLIQGRYPEISSTMVLDLSQV